MAGAVTNGLLKAFREIPLVKAVTMVAEAVETVEGFGYEDYRIRTPLRFLDAFDRYHPLSFGPDGQVSSIKFINLCDKINSLFENPILNCLSINFLLAVNGLQISYKENYEWGKGNLKRPQELQAYDQQATPGNVAPDAGNNTLLWSIFTNEMYL